MHVGVEELVRPLIVQLAVIVLLARLFAAIFRRLGQPVVVGEILAGLILGPSVLGRLFPDLFGSIFYPRLAGLTQDQSNAVLGSCMTALSQVGLIMLLFIIGLEFDFGHLRRQGRAAIAISVSGVVAPFLLGLLLAAWMGPHLNEPPQRGFSLFIGTAMAITAIPILGRIMMELNITRTKLATVTIVSAAMDDVTGWILLATVASVVRSGFEPIAMLRMAGETIAFVGVMIFVARPILLRAVDFLLQRGRGDLSVAGFAIVLGCNFACALATSYIGIFAIFGSFTMGAVLASHDQFREAFTRKLRDFVTVFFLPIFFTYTGLRTKVDSLASAELWGFCGLVLAAAVLGKFGGCGLAARLTGFSWRESACIGVMMNTRALMELIVINLGMDLGVIPESVYCMLVMMAVITTIMTTPILLRIMPGTELETSIQASSFARGRRGVPAPTAASR